MIKMQAVLKISIANGYFYNFNKRLNAALYRIQGTADGEILFLNPACRLNHGSAFY